jgi:hypothetical protein
LNAVVSGWWSVTEKGGPPVLVFDTARQRKLRPEDVDANPATLLFNEEGIFVPKMEQEANRERKI